MPSTPNGRADKSAESDMRNMDERTLCDADDERYDHGRPSSEVSEGDHDILGSEDERERLLTEQEGISSLFKKKGVKIGTRKAKASAGNGRQRRQGQTEEESALMYEMEENIGVSNSSLSSNSSQSDKQRLLAAIAYRKSRILRVWGRIAIYIAVVILFVVLLSVAYRLSKPKPTLSLATMVSNGTSLFAPTTILISLDGFRADFLYRGLTPTLNQFIADGISPKYMLPSFPSVTFPNHYTMATGLYPEAHGIVGNSFWDPKLKQEFYYTDPARSTQPFWWGGEPLWVTAERQNAVSAVHMWPGSEVHISEFEPAYVDKFNGTERLPLKVDRIFEFLDLPGPLDPGVKSNQPRPQLIAAYVPDVDGDGHKFGPNSTEIRQTIKSADDMIGTILKGLEERNLTGIVNVVVVSDHGMATTDVSRLIQLEDLIDPSEIEHIDGWPLYGLRPKNPKDLDRLHQQLVEKAKTNPNIEVYLRDKDMPERYHFSKNERIAPLWIVPKTGWAIVDKNEFNVEEGKKTGEVYHPRGLHGYDFEHPLMRAIFVARGPAFPHKPNSRMEPFQNIELYNIICDSINIIPAPNNGTLRLPLKPVGLHTDPETPADETPSDPVQSYAHSSLLVTASILSLSSMSNIAAAASGLEEHLLTSIHDTSPAPLSSINIHRPQPASTPTASAPPPEDKNQKPAEMSLWEWLKYKAEHAEEWVEEFVHNHVPGHKSKQGD